MRTSLAILLALATGLVTLSAPAQQDARLDLSEAAVDRWSDAAETGAAAPDAWLIRDVTIVDVAAGRTRPAQDLLIDAGVIAQIADASSRLRRRGARVIDGDGLFVSPGLVDAHVHLADFMLDLMPLFPAHGVTSILNLSGSPGHLTLARRISAGRLPAPTLNTSGPFIQGERLDGAGACAIARAQAAAGYRALKFYQEDMPDAEFRRFLDCAAGLGLPIFGHLPDGVDLACLSGTRFGIAHAEELLGTRWQGRDDWIANPMLRDEVAHALASSGVALIPNLGLYAGFIGMQDDDRYREMLERPEMALMPPIIRELYGPGNPYRQHRHDRGTPAARAHRMQVHLRELEAFTARFAAAGGRILVGSDAPNPMAIYGVSLHREMEALRAAGLSPPDILRAATLAPRTLTAPDTPTPIEAGATADLVITAANPLLDLAALEDPEWVVLRGVAYRPEALINAIPRNP